MKGKNNHEFALFVPDLDKKNNLFNLTENSLLHRINTVLRLKKGDYLTLFNDTYHAQGTISTTTKKTITFSITTLETHQPLTPEIVVLAPLLKREAFDELVYSCRELGVSSLIVVTTQKNSRSTLSKAEWERLERVSIAAAEQSKNFSPCVFLNKQKPIEYLEDVLKNPIFLKRYNSYTKYLANPDGSIFTKIAPSLQKDTRFLISFGSEADFSLSEKNALIQIGFTPLKLGSTVLRAQQAATILIGLIRSCF